MKLNNLLDRLQGEPLLTEVISSGQAMDVEVNRVVFDSRSVSPGDIFTCVPGGRTDGHGFARDAVDRGAVALCVARPLAEVQVPQLVSRDPRAFMGRLAATLYGWPARDLKMIGITGTNGKTTSTYMMRSILEAQGTRTGLLGTVFYCDGVTFEHADRTTPEGADVQWFLKRMRDNSCQACVMEASSHGLKQGRIEGCEFDGGLFTNLTPEHLDFHLTEDAYFDAKRLLFNRYMKEGWVGASNASDPRGAALLMEHPDRMHGYRVIGSNESPVEGCWCGRIRSYDLEGMTLEVYDPRGRLAFREVSLPLIGTYNGENAMGVIALSMGMGIGGDAVVRGLASMPQVPGRLETYRFPNRVVGVIDYAHTPDGLEKVLGALRGVTVGKLWVVFGHGGERTGSHRPKLGAVAASLADRAVVTMDNPRSEDPASIAAQIVSGISHARAREGFQHWVILDRGEAIRYALDNAEIGDVVAITGKGPERFILFSDRRVPFEDSAELRRWAEERFPGWEPRR
jgi:UDP-N-acetylmuramoyl-L-alanyl-D-glutamate--2,6-diaminopimelate ligase